MGPFHLLKGLIRAREARCRTVVAHLRSAKVCSWLGEGFWSSERALFYSQSCLSQVISLRIGHARTTLFPPEGLVGPTTPRSRCVSLFLGLFPRCLWADECIPGRLSGQLGQSVPKDRPSFSLLKVTHWSPLGLGDEIWLCQSISSNIVRDCFAITYSLCGGRFFTL